MFHHRILHYMYSEAIIQSITGGLDCTECTECTECIACLCLGIRSTGSLTGEWRRRRMERIESGRQGDTSEHQRLSDPSRWKKQE